MELAETGGSFSREELILVEILCPCLFGNGGGCLGFLRVGEIPVPIRRYQECSGTVLVLEARLTADVIVVKVSCSIPHVSSMAIRRFQDAPQLFRNSHSRDEVLAVKELVLWFSKAMDAQAVLGSHLPSPSQHLVNAHIPAP
ncbi:hypothetical protein Bca52824_074617 [Brassica carinata]|uniref:Uncharacterized protein n=1 Tax=Brassica carinata TaxID=52824 RepID=A0A8X7PQV0_BRACI|nr:hypothetical protein Bca52824_074617 [Brassica carinata]